MTYYYAMLAQSTIKFLLLAIAIIVWDIRRQIRQEKSLPPQKFQKRKFPSTTN